MNKHRLPILIAFSFLLIIAVAVGCGTPGVNFLIPVQGAGAKFAFVVNSHPDSNVTGVNISAFTIDAATGKLTAVPTSPFATQATGGGGTLFIDVDPNGKFLYVPNRGANTVSVFSIASDGALSPVGTAANTGGNDAFSVKVHPNGQFLYVANRVSDDITVFSISSSGALTPVGTPVAADGDPHHLIMDPKGRFLYATIWGEGYAVDGYAIHPDGSLTMVPGGLVLTEKNPQSGTVDSTGKFLLVANRWSSNLNVYSIDQTNGNLTEIGGSPFNSGNGPFHVVEVAAGGVTYMAVNNEGEATIAVFSFDANTGALTSVGSPFGLGLNRPHWMAIDPSGKFGYIADQGNDNIVGVTVNSSGVPTAISGSPFSGGGVSEPSQIVISK